MFGVAAILLAVLFATPILGLSGSSEVSALENPNFYLWAGQTIYAGNGTVTNDGDSLNFTIDPAPGYPVSLIHVNIYTSAPPGGQSALGSFPWHVDYSSSPQTTQFSFELPTDATQHSIQLIGDRLFSSDSMQM